MITTFNIDKVRYCSDKVNVERCVGWWNELNVLSALRISGTSTSSVKVLVSKCRCQNLQKYNPLDLLREGKMD